MNKVLLDVLTKVRRYFGLLREWDLIQARHIYYNSESGEAHYYPAVRVDKLTGYMEYRRLYSIFPGVLLLRWLPVGHKTWLLRTNPEVVTKLKAIVKTL